MANDVRRVTDRQPSSRGRHRAARPSTSASVRSIAGESLVRNSGFLVVNLIFSAACGYGALSLLTRLYSVQAVGLSATALSTGSLIVFIMQFGVNYSLPRYLPTSKNRTALINTVLTVTLIASLLGAAVFLALPVAEKLYALGGGLFAGAFVLATFVQAGEAGLGTVLVADRSSSNVAAANSVPNLIKLAAPIAFTFLGAFGAYAARVVSDVVGFFVFGAVLRRKGHRFRPAINVAAVRDLGRFSLGMYTASILGGLPLMVLPIIILARFGSTQSAYWSVAISVASLLFQLPSMIGQALLPEVAHRPAERRHLVRRSALLVSVIAIPVLVIAYFAAPLGLALFGSHYVHGALGPLRWLIVAGFITVMNYASGTVLLLAKKTFVISVINVIDAIVVVGLALTWASGAQGAAISWLIGDIGNTVLFGVFAIIAIRQVHGRWEDLGGGALAAGAETPDYEGASVASQLQALDVLLKMARPQGPVPSYAAGGIPDFRGTRRPADAAPSSSPPEYR